MSKPKPPPEVKTCDQCGASYTPDPRNWKKQRYCSKLCLHRSKLPTCRAWYERNKDYATAKAREWREKNLDYAKAKSYNYYLDHRDEHRESLRAKFQENRRSFPWRNLLASAKNRAAKAGLDFTLTEEWAIERWTGRCEVTDIEFRYTTRRTGSRFYSPSIDQITAGKGYTPDNCRFVLWAVNALKYDGTNDDMVRVARAIVLRYGA